MPRKNLLSLHEAIVVALINQKSRTASFEEIADFIVERNLYPERKGNIPLATQVMLRSTKAKGAYHHLFEEIDTKYIRLKDTYADFPLLLSAALEEILRHNQSLFHSEPQTTRMFDVKLDCFRNVAVHVNNIVCVLTKEKSGEKKYMYLLETDLKGNESIGVYTINLSMSSILDMFDPHRFYLSLVNDSSAVNVSFYKIGRGKIVVPSLPYPEINSLLAIKFSTSPKAKQYFKNFERIQKAYTDRISFEKSILDRLGQNLI